MQEQKKKITIQLLYQIVLFHRCNLLEKEELSNFICLLHLEKLLYLSIKEIDLPFNFTEEFTKFIKKEVNIRSMDALNQNGSEDQVNLITKAVDMLMIKDMQNQVTPLEVLGECKALTFNNMASIYHKKNKLNLAMEAINYALEIEKRLYKQNEVRMYKTMMNKAAIVSQMKKHVKSIDILLVIVKGLDSVKTESQDRIREVNHLLMLTHFNMGVQNEYLFLEDKAKSCYTKSLMFAQDDKTIIIEKINRIDNENQQSFPTWRYI